LLESITIVKNTNATKDTAENTPKKSKELQEILNYAKENMIPLDGKKTTSIEDVFYAIMFIENELSEIFRDFALEPNTYKETTIELGNGYLTEEEDFYDYVEFTNSQTNKPLAKNEILDKYCSNLNKMALENKLDASYGRENELNQIYRILLRTRKSNPILIGQAGVGKTNVVEGLAYNIVTGVAPENLLNKTIYSLNLNSVVAGTNRKTLSLTCSILIFLSLY